MSRHLVIGTAGHIDHGKTALVRALTGCDTDRLPEEQARGISIDLGFAALELADGRTVSIIDVPGHERFIRNMVAGITGIDAVVLVIAADEGVMPQTREHLDIVSMLGIKSGIVVLTKRDLVWPEWLEEMQGEVRAALAGTPLEDAPLLSVSSLTGQGIDGLIEALAELQPEISSSRSAAPARLAIDRTFTVAGFGPVVTGTLAAGSLRVGDRLQVLPVGGEARVRGLEIHSHTVLEAAAGQRVAVNLSGMQVGELERGQVLVEPGRYLAVRGFGGSLSLLAHSKQTLSTGARVRLHTGTAELLGRISLLDRDELLAGDSCHVHFRAENPLVVAAGDRFIIRSYSPAVTLGGGRVLDVMRRYKRFEAAGLAELEAREQGQHSVVAGLVLNRADARPLPEEALARRLGLWGPRAMQVIEELVRGGGALRAGRFLVGSSALERIKADIVAALCDYHRRYPLRPGMPRAQLRQAMLPRGDARTSQALVELMVEHGVLAVAGEHVSLPSFTPSLSATQEQQAAELLRSLELGGFEPEPLTVRDAELLHYLHDRGDIVVVSPELAFSSGAVRRATEALRRHLVSGEQGITVAEVRDLLDTSRRFALAILNHLDAAGITRRDGDLRYLRRKEADAGDERR